MPKKRKRAQSPPLWIGDKILYIIGAVLMFVCIAALALLPSYLRQRAVEADPSMVAYISSGASFLIFPFLFYASLSLLLFTANSWSSRVPLLGNPKVKYGQYPWKKDVYPLLRKKPASFYAHPSHRKTRHVMLILWSAVLIFTIFLGCFSIYGRDCLRDDLHIVSYNWRNRQTQEEYAPADFESLTLCNKVHYSRNEKTYRISFTLSMSDGQQFSFSSGNFKDVSQFAQIAMMLRNRCTNVSIDDGGILPLYIEKYNLTNAEAALLYQLFDVT